MHGCQNWFLSETEAKECVPPGKQSPLFHDQREAVSHHGGGKGDMFQQPIHSFTLTSSLYGGRVMDLGYGCCEQVVIVGWQVTYF